MENEREKEKKWKLCNSGISEHLLARKKYVTCLMYCRIQILFYINHYLDIIFNNYNHNISPTKFERLPCPLYV
jgi:hypothetical protein